MRVNFMKNRLEQEKEALRLGKSEAEGVSIPEGFNPKLWGAAMRACGRKPRRIFHKVADKNYSMTIWEK